MRQYIVKSFLDCQRCDLCKYRRNVVFGRGSIPADILFIGEAPGKSEDMRGVPFIGQSGNLLDKSIDLACKMAGLKCPPTYFITNTVGCRPTDFLDGPNREPSKEEIWRCFERLERTYKDIHPRKVVFLGKIAQRYCHKAWPDASMLPHPAYLLRLGGFDTPAATAFARDLSKLFLEVLS